MFRTLHFAVVVASVGTLAAQNFTTLPTDIGIGYFPAMDLADLDGDGKLDLLICGGVVNSQAVTRLYLGDGRGGFAETPTQPFINVQDGDVALADIDGDGDVDALVTGMQNAGGWATRLYRNDGRAGFTEVENQPFANVENGAVAFSDVDGDGDADALVVGLISSFDNGANLYINDGTGAFTAVAPTGFKEPYQAAIGFADLDGDRDDDLIIGGTSWPQSAPVYRNDGGGRFSEYPQVGYSGVSYSAIALGDVDGDGDIDALFSGADGATSAPMSRLYLNDGTADFTLAFPQPFRDAQLGGIALTDVDRDGDLDAIFSGQMKFTAGPNSATIVYLNDGKGNFTEAPVQPFASLFLSAIKAVDLDGDGDEDIILAGQSQMTLRYETTVYRNDAGVIGVGDAFPQNPVLRVWPNPVRAGERLSVEYEADKTGIVDVRIVDINGRVLSASKTSVVAGPQSILIDVPSLLAGTYKVGIGRHRARFVVLNAR